MKQSRKTPSLRIVTPSFNQGRFIRQTIESVLSQLLPGDSYYVIDGGSTDDTIEILQSYGDKLQWISAKDDGQADAINKGINKLLEASDPGDVFAYINSDDFYLPGALAYVRQQFGQDDMLTWLVGDAKIVNESGDEIQKLIRIYKKTLRYLSVSLGITNSYPQPSVFLRTSVVNKLGKFNEKLHYVMDYEYWLRVAQIFGTPYFVSTALSAFRIHNASKGGSQYIEQFAEELKVARKYTKNPFIFWLHRFHNQCIVHTYGLIK